MNKTKEINRRIFISYHILQRDWVENDLYPLLEAAGGEVFADFKTAPNRKRRLGQMDHVQRNTDITLCLLEPSYCKCQYCMHELNTALSLQDDHHTVIPVIMKSGSITQCLGEFNAIRKVNLTDPESDDEWQLLFELCGITFSGSAADWLRDRSCAHRS